METRTVVLHRARRGFGFVLRGAKASSPLMELRPSERCPALQYLDDVDAGGVADRAGLRKGDFLVAINGEDVSAASHEHVVELIRGSGALVSMTVVSLAHAVNNENNTCTVPTSKSQNQLSSSGRPYAATLPRKAAGGRSPAPAPPRRDPRTTLSVGRARAKSMVAGLENGGEKEESCEPLSVAGKSSSAESVQLHGGSNTGTPSGTPPAPRTASIRARPASGRITAAELEELFQRQAGADNASNSSGMMTRSAFTGGAGSPPASPASPARSRVYVSVADMKRSKGKVWSKCGSLRREFHSTPDLAAELAARPPRTRSSEDMHGARAPPPAEAPPPPPAAPAAPAAPASSFRPAAPAKLYASPRDLAAVAYRAAADPASASRAVPIGVDPRPALNWRVWQVAHAHAPRQWAGRARAASADDAAHQYAQPISLHKTFARQNSTPAPPIPEPDYSMSESDDDAPKRAGEPPGETSANSNTSGSSSGSGSMQHSFSVDEIQKIRTRLKSSKSCGDELAGERDDGDNSSSGVSSDQEAQARPRRDKVSFCSSVTVKSSNDVISTEPVHSSSESLAPMARHNSLTRRRAAALARAGAARGRSAAERLGVDPERAPGRRRAAVSLAELPPPPEEPPGEPLPAPPVLAPPPQFSDRVRVVAALPKLH
ncbi:unnamed protein product [Euphydryas editha]|uniref:PDZ domain-containing protein n=1 Tax=Euphydryas editha TaxID=104508 RepID=A0AAU9TXF3_EUPED|nr:unnamed protein product [Euphydryas editha]